MPSAIGFGPKIGPNRLPVRRIRPKAYAENPPVIRATGTPPSKIHPGRSPLALGRFFQRPKAYEERINLTMRAFAGSAMPAAISASTALATRAAGVSTALDALGAAAALLSRSQGISAIRDSLAANVALAARTIGFSAAQEALGATAALLTRAESIGAARALLVASSGTVALVARSLATSSLRATLTIAAPVDRSIDPFAAEEYRRSLRKLAELAEEHRRARDDEATEIHREIQAAISGAAEIEAAEVQTAYAAVKAATPGRAPERITEAQITRVTDWAPLFRALEQLRAAIEFERALDEDDEEVMLLI